MQRNLENFADYRRTPTACQFAGMCSPTQIIGLIFTTRDHWYITGAINMVRGQLLEARFQRRAVQWRSQPRKLGSQNFGWGKMFDFRRITLFCPDKRLSKHKMTVFSKNLEVGHGPFAPLATPMGPYLLI